MSEWISVKDRLPEDGVQVLALITEGFAEYFLAERLEGEWRTSECTSLDYITHWMPLHEPPRVE